MMVVAAKGNPHMSYPIPSAVKINTCIKSALFAGALQTSKPLREYFRQLYRIICFWVNVYVFTSWFYSEG